MNPRTSLAKHRNPNHLSITASLLMALAIPAIAQIDLSGEWAPRFHEDQPERIPGPEIGDYLGLPINDAARLRGDSWDAGILTLPEHQCKPHPADYGPRGPANLRIWKEVDGPTQRIVAWHTHISWQAPERTIWMDGRPHPPAYAPHTWQGFSTGVWDGDILTVTTTHLKTGWIRRNGIPRSDRGVLLEHWIRHGDALTLVSIVNDPIYLTEPFLRSTDFELDPHQQIDPYPCEAVVEVPRPVGQVPQHLPGENPFLTEFSASHKIPQPAARGGAVTMYPEYRVSTDTAVAANPALTASLPPQGTDIEVWPVQGNIYMLVGAGGNTTLQVGSDGLLIVDTELAAQAKQLAAAIQKVSAKPIRYIINTSADATNTGGNESLSALGSTITGGNVATGAAGFPATVVAHESVVSQMTEAGVPATNWPNDTYFTSVSASAGSSTAGKDIFFNGEAVRVLHAPAAHTGGDSIVFFRRSDVVSTGNLFVPDRYPVIDVARGGSLKGIVDAMNQLLDLTIPADKQEGGTMVVPGFGRLCDEADVVEYRDMLTILLYRFQDMVKKGMTLEQVKVARPTRDYDPLYGPSDAFVEAAYRSLRNQPRP